MKIIINGTERTTDTTILKDILETELNLRLTDTGTAENGNKLGIAVAIDETVVPRSQWNRTEVREGARLEIITAVQGG